MTENPGDDKTLVGTVNVLIRALRTLGQSGDPDTANRLAAQAWLTLRDHYPRQAERLNGTIHYLVGLPQTSTSTNPTPTPQEEK